MNEKELEELKELKTLVSKLFTDYLDVVEESDSGNLFHPIFISCCRVMKQQPLCELIDKIKELSCGTPQEDVHEKN